MLETVGLADVPSNERGAALERQIAAICKGCQIVQINIRKGDVFTKLQVFRKAKLKAKPVANLRLSPKFKPKPALHRTWNHPVPVHFRQEDQCKSHTGVW